LPNLASLISPAQKHNGVVYPGYTTEPAPLGLADYGLGVTPYAYNTSYMEGTVTFTAPPNVTQPGASNIILPTPQGERLGDVGSEYEFGIQLNTIGNNLTIPGDYNSTTNMWNGSVWAQNVANWNDSGIHFIQDTWNFSWAAGGAFNYNSIYSGCGGNTSWANDILYVYGHILQCSEGNVPLVAADYPVSLSLYNNFTVNAQDRDQLVYGYDIYEAGVGRSISGIADTVVFNNTISSGSSLVAPANKPGNTINPFSLTPDGILRQDAEMDIVGGIEGDNGVFTSINGSVTLQYSNSTSGPWQSVPSAYNFGSDTGETSMGIADYWTPSHVLEINQGPTMLYGLWNAVPAVSVASGDIQVAGTISPSYGFVFVSNTPPVLDPWTGVQQDNMSWLPSTSTGAFNTYLPPLAAPWTTTYYVQAFASGSTEYNGTVTGSTTSLSITLSAAPGTTFAPLYMSTAAQASALALALGGSASAPYVFDGVTVNANFTFAHLNDWLFPSFEMFQSVGVNDVVVDDSYLGTDSFVDGNSYIWDGAAGSAFAGFFVPSPILFLDGGGYTSGINIFYGANDQVQDQELITLGYLLSDGYGYFSNLGASGYQLTLWGDSHAWVNDVISGSVFTRPDSMGVFVGMSVDTRVTNVTTDYESVGVTDMVSTGTVVWNVNAFDDSVGIEAYGGGGGTYSWINASYGFFAGATGIETGYDFGPGALYQSIYDIPGTVGLTINDLNATDDSIGANITLSPSTTINDVAAYDPLYYESQGLQFDSDSGLQVNGLVATNASGFFAWNVTNAVFNGVVLDGISDYYENSQVWASTNVVFNDPTVISTGEGLYNEETYFEAYGLGIVADGVTGLALHGAFVSGVPMENIYQFGGIITEYVTNFVGTNLSSTYGIFSYEADYGAGTFTVAGVSAVSDSLGLNVVNTPGASVSYVNATDGVTVYADDWAGVNFFESTGGSVAMVVADDAVGVRMFEGANGNSITTVSATDGSIGVYVEDSSSEVVTGVTASDDSTGVLVDDTLGSTFTGVSASDGAIGVSAEDSANMTISGSSASDYSSGNIVEDSVAVTISGTAASDYSVGDQIIDSSMVTDTGASATGGNSTAVLVYGDDEGGASFISVSDVSATATSLPPIYMTGCVESDEGCLPFAAVVTEYTAATTISDVTATDYFAAVYDYDSNGLQVSNVNATGGDYAVALDDSYGGYFYGIGAFQDWVGFYMYDAYQNFVTGSSFVDDTSYGVALFYSYGNTISGNNFIGDNGATNTYNAAHIQAWSSDEDQNSFNTCANDFCTAGIGNYWADWHTYGSNGYLAPYVIGGASEDLFPTGPQQQETFTVNFVATGLPAGTAWSVTLGGAMQTSKTAVISFPETMGTYAYAVGSISGWASTPSSGSVTVSGATYNVSVTFSAVVYAVTLSAGGLSSDTTWSATVNGVTQSTAGTSLVFYLPAGTYTYVFNNVSGYNLPSTGASGSLTVVAAPVSLATSYSPSSTTSYVTTDTFNTWLAVLIAIAVIALVIGLLAVLLFRRRPPASTTAPAQAWTPPEGSAAANPPASGGTGTWSEGPPAGGSPPS
jgi:parallel beta-helix repeat protein